MQTKTDSYWKDLKVEGKRVVTISRDKTNDTRTIIFLMKMVKMYTMRL